MNRKEKRKEVIKKEGLYPRIGEYGHEKERKEAVCVWNRSVKDRKEGKYDRKHSD